jgi:hypothetical protein
MQTSLGASGEVERFTVVIGEDGPLIRATAGTIASEVVKA